MVRLTSFNFVIIILSTVIAQKCFANVCGLLQNLSGEMDQVIGAYNDYIDMQRMFAYEKRR